MGYIRMNLENIVKESEDLIKDDYFLKEIIDTLTDNKQEKNYGLVFERSVIKLIDGITSSKDVLDLEALCGDIVNSIILYVDSKHENMPHALRFILDSYRSCMCVDKSKATKENIYNKVTASLAKLLYALFDKESTESFEVEYNSGRTLYYLNFYLKEMS